MAHAIFMTFDDNYAAYAKTCLLSIEKNYGNHPEILAFYDGAEPAMMAFLNTINNLRVMPFDFSFLELGGISLGPVNSAKVYFRYILWTEALAGYDTVVHLDVDTLVLEPFDELFREESFFAVMDHTPFNLTLFQKKHYYSRQLLGLLAADGLAGPAERFHMMNAGVFAIPKKYRTRAQFEKLVGLTRRYNDFTRFADQAVISLWCHQNNISFSNRMEFNFQAAHLCNQQVMLDEQIQRTLSGARIRIFHFSWWKPDTIFYRKFLEYVRFLSEADRDYVQPNFVLTPKAERF